MDKNISYDEIKHYAMDYHEDDYVSILNPDQTRIGIWTKIRKFAKEAGEEVIYKVLLLFYALKFESNKELLTLIYGALGYFIFPYDVIYDYIPVIGFTDDLIVLNMVLDLVYICDEIKERSLRQLDRWFDLTEDQEQRLINL